MRSRSHGYTIVDSFAAAVIASAALMVAAPAMQDSREGSRRDSCAHHLQKLVIGFQNHRDVHIIWPNTGHARNYHASITKEMKPYIGPRQNLGWGYQILPYLEGDDAYDGRGPFSQSGEDINGLAERSTNAAAATLPSFYCPARRQPSTNKKPRGFPNDGMAKIWDPWENKHVDIRGKPVAAGLGQTDYAIPIGRHRSGAGDHGIVMKSHHADPRNPLQSVAAIPDGESQTFILADKRLRLSSLGQDQTDDNEGFAVGWDHDSVRDTVFFRPPMPDPQGDQSRDPEDGCGKQADRRDVAWTDIDGVPRGPTRTCAKVVFGDWRFGGSHPGGFNLAMADGSVHFVDYKIEMDVFADLGNRKDQNPIPRFGEQIQ